MPSQKFAGEFINLAKISRFIAEQAELVGLDERATYEVQLAVDEACANIIEHAYGGEGKGDIEIACNISAEGLEVILKDQGQTFDLDEIGEIEVGIPLEELGNRGAGVFLMRKLMDEVQFEFSKKAGTVLKMKKSLPPKND
ncbi:ATP-binding protein [bacterium]|nr:ATP-binding protein [bacterium]